MTKRKLKKPVPLCQCGCNFPVQKARNGTYNKFLLGHNSKHSKSNQPAKTGSQGRFIANVSGNPKGRPQGSKSKCKLSMENAFAKEETASAISSKCIELALNGNIAALKICIDRVLPPVKSTPVNLPDLPVIESVGDVPLLTAYLLKAVGDGVLTPEQSSVISKCAEQHLRALTVSDLGIRLEQLEAQLLETGQ